MIFPTLNLADVDEGCAGIGHLMKPLNREVRVLMKNCFAFGGINAALLCRRLQD